MRPGQQLARAGRRVPGLQHLQPPRIRPGSAEPRGRTRPLSFNATVSATADEVWLDAEVPVNRADFGLTYSPLHMASLDNTITVHAVFTRQ